MACKIIADIGWNHMGDMKLAKEMISAAAESGADYAKFQTWSFKNLKKGPWDHDGRAEIYKKAQLSQNQYYELKEFCERNKIEFLTSIFNPKDVDWLKKLNLNSIKIPSHEAYNVNLLSKVNGIFKQVFVSTGATKWEEVTSIPSRVQKSQLILLHCVSAYPCPAEKVNLPRINELKQITVYVGYSGHYFGIDDALASLNYGVSLIEKHFTINRNLPGRDNKFAILPDQLKILSSYCTNFESLNKDLGRNMQPCENDIYKNYRGRWSGCD